VSNFPSSNWAHPSSAPDRGVASVEEGMMGRPADRLTGRLKGVSAAGVLVWSLCSLIVVAPLLAGGNELYAVSPSTAMLAAQLLVLGMSVGWWVARLDDWRWGRLPWSVALCGGAWIVWTALSTVTSEIPYQSEVKVISLAVGVVLAYAAIDLLRSERDLHRAAWAVLAGGALAAFYGIVQGVIGLPNWLIQAQNNRASQDLIELVSQGRIFSTFLNVNAFAAYLAMAAPIGAYLVLTETRPLRHDGLSGRLGGGPCRHGGGCLGCGPRSAGLAARREPARCDPVGRAACRRFSLGDPADGDRESAGTIFFSDHGIEGIGVRSLVLLAGRRALDRAASLAGHGPRHLRQQLPTRADRRRLCALRS